MFINQSCFNFENVPPPPLIKNLTSIVPGLPFSALRCGRIQGQGKALWFLSHLSTFVSSGCSLTLLTQFLQVWASCCFQISFRNMGNLYEGCLWPHLFRHMRESLLSEVLLLLLCATVFPEI